MKQIIFILFISFCINSFSQGVEDLGKTSYDQVKKMNDASPCEVTPNVILTYCVEDGSYMSYTFEKNKLNGIIFLTAFLTKTLAEKDLINQVNEFSRISGKKPVYTGGIALFKMTENVIVTYEVREYEGTNYVSYSTLLTD